MFVDRDMELAFLERTWNSGRAEFIVVYGRRRVGKTALLRTFCRDRSHTFWVASLSSEAILRQSFTDALWQSSHPDETSAGFNYESWERAFGALAELAQDQRHCVVIDEFPYLAGSDPSVPSVLQKVWDERLQHTNLMLVLCGSHIGMMERQVLDYQAPLYGRRTGQMQLRPLPLHASAGLMPHLDPVSQIETYAVLGGIATYWAQFDPQSSLLDNIEQHILNPASYLYQEPLFLLREELQEPRNYFAILQAIAQGRTRLNEVVQITGMDRGPASRYLAILQDLRLVERRVPVTEPQPDKSRKGSYRLRDPFLAFWFRFVAPYVSILESGHTAPVARRIESELSTFLGPLFEDICREWLTDQAALGRLPFLPERLGAWWDGREEIDVVALGPDAALFGECKWTSRPVGANVLDDLKRKAHPLLQSARLRNAHYALFARSGFTEGLAAQAEHENILLVGPETLVMPPL
jgi:AAA+ ATPase superfamily predicted ATPase